MGVPGWYRQIQCFLCNLPWWMRLFCQLSCLEVPLSGPIPRIIELKNQSAQLKAEFLPYHHNLQSEVPSLSATDIQFSAMSTMHLVLDPNFIDLNGKHWLGIHAYASVNSSTWVHDNANGRQPRYTGSKYTIPHLLSSQPRWLRAIQGYRNSRDGH